MLILLLLVAILTVVYLVFFCKKVIKLVYVIEESKDESLMYEKYQHFKVFSYIEYAVLLFIGLFLGRYITLSAWVSIYCIFWTIGVFFIHLNLKLILHFLDSLFVADALTEIDKDYLIGGINIENGYYYFFYRLTGDKFKI